MCLVLRVALSLGHATYVAYHSFVCHFHNNELLYVQWLKALEVPHAVAKLVHYNQGIRFHNMQVHDTQPPLDHCIHKVLNQLQMSHMAWGQFDTKNTYPNLLLHILSGGVGAPLQPLCGRNGGCCMAISSSPITAPFPFPFLFFEPGVGNQEVDLSKQSVNECDLSLLLMIDSHHQQKL